MRYQWECSCTYVMRPTTRPVLPVWHGFDFQCYRLTEHITHKDVFADVVMLVPFSYDLSCCSQPNTIQGGPKWESGFSFSRVLLARVWLPLERGFAAHFYKARLGMRLRFKCLFFQQILLVQFPKSQDSCCSSSWWFVPTFVVAIVVSARACISKPLGHSLSCHLANVWLSDIKKKIQK